MSGLYEPRSTRIEGAPATAHFPRFGPATAFLFDSDEPKRDPNEVYAEQGGYTDPRSMNHNCPVCNRTMSYDLFVTHAEPCYRKWRSVSLNKSRRTFAGAAPEQTRSTTINATSASADAGGAE